MDDKKNKDSKPWEAEIDALSHLDMCRYWRFGCGKSVWFDSTHPASTYFKERLFIKLGGFTPAISKEIGW